MLTCTVSWRASGIDVAGESQMVGYPSQFPGVSMVDWNTGQPNARFWVLKLLHDNFGPGDKLVETTACGSLRLRPRVCDPRRPNGSYYWSTSETEILICRLPGGNGAEVMYVDQTTGFQPPATAHLNADQMTLRGLGVAVVTLPK